jgi:D-cysteine desulfhydrase
VHVAAGTLGTAAGLALGLALAGETTRIVATRITSRLVTSDAATRRLLERTASLLERAGITVPLEIAADMIELHHDQLGPGYGRETAAGREATRLFAEAGLALDPTYTAKAAATLLASAAVADGVPLFLHTLSAAEPVDLLHGVTAADLPAPFRRYLER